MAGNFAFLTLFFLFPFVFFFFFFTFLPMSLQGVLALLPLIIILQVYGSLQTLARDGVNSFFFPILLFGSLFAWELSFLSNSTRSVCPYNNSSLRFYLFFLFFFFVESMFGLWRVSWVYSFLQMGFACVIYLRTKLLYLFIYRFYLLLCSHNAWFFKKSTEMKRALFMYLYLHIWGFDNF